MASLIIAIVVLVALALYLVASPKFGERAYHYALFAPWKYPVGKYDGEIGSSGKYEDVYFNAVDGKKLHGWFFPGSKPYTILVHHGKTGNITDIEQLNRLLLETGASILVYDYRGFGRSEGSPSLKIICEDGVSAFKYLTNERKIPANQIVAYGESLGGLVACYQAEHTKMAGIILQSAFSSLRIISIENLGGLRIFPDFLFPSVGRNSEIIARCEIPTLIIHGALDDDIVVEHSHRLHASARFAKDLVILQNTLHDEIDKSDADTFLHAINSFLDSLDKTKQIASQPRELS
ncbi:MAG TPA: alpha/beta fold hydrolase [Drouetiella sp.]